MLNSSPRQCFQEPILRRDLASKHAILSPATNRFQWMHDVSMLYTFILWAVIGGFLAIFIILQFIRPTGNGNSASPDSENQNSTTSPTGWYYRAWRATQASLRRYLLPESLPSIFGHTTRLQILTLFILSSYLIVFS
jgi:hypothetical protein